MRGRHQTVAIIPLICFSEGRKTQIQDIGMIAKVFRSLRSQEEITLKKVHLKVPVPSVVASP